MDYKDMQDDLDAIMSKEGGRRFIMQLLLEAGTDESCFCADPQLLAYYEGRRSLGVAVLGEVRRLTSGLEYERQMRIEARARLPSALRKTDDIYDLTAK